MNARRPLVFIKLSREGLSEPWQFASLKIDSTSRGCFARSAKDVPSLLKDVQPHGGRCIAEQCDVTRAQ